MTWRFLLQIQVAFGGIKPASKPTRTADQNSEKTAPSNSLALPGSCFFICCPLCETKLVSYFLVFLTFLFLMFTTSIYISCELHSYVYNQDWKQVSVIYLLRVPFETLLYEKPCQCSLFSALWFLVLKDQIICSAGPEGSKELRKGTTEKALVVGPTLPRSDL